MCINAGTGACVNVCAEEREGRFFMLDRDITIEEMPPFPIESWQFDSSPKERQIMAGVYLTKLVERAQERISPKYYYDSPAYVEMEGELVERNLYDPDVWERAIIGT
jgi:hypothetical protein